MHSSDVANEEVDLDQHPNAKALVDRCREFFSEVEDLYVHQYCLFNLTPQNTWRKT